MMSLKYDNFIIYWAVVTENKTFKECLCKGIVPGILNNKSAISLSID